MFGSGKRGEAKPAHAEAKPTGPARAVEEIDEEISKLTKPERERAEKERERLQRIDQLRRERERSVAEAEEAQRQAKLAALLPVLERQRAAWLKEMSSIDDGMRALMRQYAETLRHRSAIRKTQIEIEAHGGKVTRIRWLDVSKFLDYFTYEKMQAFWREIYPADRAGRDAENQPLKTA